MNNILFGNNNQSVIRKMARKNLASSRSRNIFLVLAIFMTTFMLATIISLCVNQIEMERMYSFQYYGVTDGGIEGSNYVLAMLAVLLMVAGFLLIHNVMSVSISKDIRFYGLLRAVGMTEKQINRMVRRQILWLCAIGIPFGLLFSILVSQVVVPLYLSMYPEFLEAGYPFRFHPLIFIGAALFVVMTAMAGAYRPARKAAQVSPVEAVRFSEYGYAREKILYTPFRPVKMAWRNVFRMPKHTLLVFFSLFLGMTMFMAVSIVLGSTSTEMFAEMAAANVKGDIYLRNGMSDQYRFLFDNNLYVFSPELMDSLGELPGLEEMRVGYFHKIRMDILDDAGEMRNDSGCVYGVDAKGFAELNKELEQPIDEAAFERGEFVVIRDIWKEPQPDTGSVEFVLENRIAPVSFVLGGILPSEFQDYFGTSYNRLPCVYMSDSLLKKLVGEPAVYEVELDIAEDSQRQALNMVKELTAGYPDIIFCSEIEIRQDAENKVGVLTVIGNSIAVILWLIGILNFSNVIATSILSRRHEFALLESVGQTRRQSKKILMYEGFIYASGTLILVGIFGSAVIYGLYVAVKRQFEYMVFRFPFVSLFIMVFVTFAICFTITEFVYGFVGKETIADRLKEKDAG